MAWLNIEQPFVTPEVIQIGGMVRIRVLVRNSAGTLATPGTTKQVHIYDPNGTEVASSPFALTADATGDLSYNYQTVTSIIPGPYSIKVETVDGGNTQEKSLKDAFETTTL